MTKQTTPADKAPTKASQADKHQPQGDTSQPAPHTEDAPRDRQAHSETQAEPAEPTIAELTALVRSLQQQLTEQQQQPKSSTPIPQNEVRKVLTALDLEIAEVELETKKLGLERAKHENREYKETEEGRRRKAEQAQAILASERNNAARKKAICEHATGGFGNEDTYQGDGKPSLIMQDLPVAGRKQIICFRCMGEWFNPDPNLKHKDIDAYADALAEWNQMLKLLRKSMSKPLSGPIFQFEKGGIPVSPPIA